MMKKLLSLSLVLSLLLALFPTSHVLAAEDGSFFFDLESSVRTDATRHRNLVPLPGINVRIRKKVSSPAYLTIMVPEKMPAIFSSEMSQAQILGSTVVGKVNNPTKASLSDDQKSLRLKVTADLAQDTGFLLTDVYLKVYSLDGSTYPLILEYTNEAGETVQLNSDATIFLNRSEGTKRNDNPEPFREVVLSNEKPEILMINWTPSPDLDFAHYTLTVREHDSQRNIVNDTIQSRQSTSYSTGGLEAGKSYDLILKTVDSGNLETAYERTFIAGSVNKEVTVTEEEPTEVVQESPYRYPEQMDDREVYAPTGRVVPSRYNDPPDSYNAPITRQNYCSTCTADQALEKLAERTSEAFAEKILDREDVFEVLSLDELEGVLSATTNTRLDSIKKRLRRKRADGQLLNLDAIEILYYLVRFERLRPQLRLVRPQYTEDMESSQRRVLRQLYEIQRRGLLTTEESPLISDPYEALTQESWLEALTDFYEMLDQAGR